MTARSFTEQAIGHPEGDALTEAARAIWRGSRFLRGWNACFGAARRRAGYPTRYRGLAGSKTAVGVHVAVSSTGRP